MKSGDVLRADLHDFLEHILLNTLHFGRLRRGDENIHAEANVDLRVLMVL